jgi:hypothetical protein
VVVLVELGVITWVRHRYMDTLAFAIAHNGSGFLAHQRRVGVRANGSEMAG